MQTDVHTHTTFSDGSALSAMVEAAESAGLDALGLTDHCIVVEDDFGRRERYDLVETYDQRRQVIDDARAETDLRLYDAAEVSYVESAEDETRAFLSAADFAYTIGSVHFADPYDYTSGSQYADFGGAERRAAVERYYDAIEALIDSELFDVAAHLDLVERKLVAEPERNFVIALAMAPAGLVAVLQAAWTAEESVRQQQALFEKQLRAAVVIERDALLEVRTAL